MTRIAPWSPPPTATPAAAILEEMQPNTSPTPRPVQHTIREATPDVNAVALARFAARTFPDACPVWLPRREIESFIETQLSVAQFERWLADPTAHVFVAEHQGEVTGYATALYDVYDDGPAAWATERSAYLSKLYVDEAHRGSGLAGRLLDAAKEAATADGCVGLWLGVATENQRARAFYTKSGLHQAGGRAFSVGSLDFIDDMYAVALA